MQTSNVPYTISQLNRSSTSSSKFNMHLSRSNNEWAGSSRKVEFDCRHTPKADAQKYYVSLDRIQEMPTSRKAERYMDYPQDRCNLFQWRYPPKSYFFERVRDAQDNFYSRREFSSLKTGYSRTPSGRSSYHSGVYKPQIKRFYEVDVQQSMRSRKRYRYDNYSAQNMYDVAQVYTSDGYRISRPRKYYSRSRNDVHDRIPDKCYYENSAIEISGLFQRDSFRGPEISTSECDERIIRTKATTRPKLDNTVHKSGPLKANLTIKIDPPPSLIPKLVTTSPNDGTSEAEKTTCQVCKKTFSAKGSLTRHKLTHTNERPFPCTICKKKFRQRSHLKKHVRLHTGEKPFGCPLCPWTFTQRSSLAGHIRAKHAFLVPHKCYGCGLTFPSIEAVKTHRMSKCAGKASVKVAKAMQRSEGGATRRLQFKPSPVGLSEFC